MFCCNKKQIQEQIVQPLNYLDSIVYKDTIPFMPPISKGKVVKVYDGDTITIATKLDGFNNSPVYRFQVRLNGIDTPEIKSHDEKEKEMAQIARDSLHALIFGKIVRLENIQHEKYGRVLCEVILQDDKIEININQWMIKNKFAIPYDGRKKAEWSFT
jgi:endonuclease YncB( thermonuclease family)